MTQNMKQKKQTAQVLWALCLALWGSIFTLHGQTAIGDSVAYKEALIEMIEQSGDLLKFRNATTGFQTMALGKISSSEKEGIQKMTDAEKRQMAEKLTTEYFETQFHEDIAGLLWPDYAGNVSLEQLKDYTECLKDERLKTAIQHSTAAMMTSSMQTDLTAGMTAIMTGKPAAPVPAKDCPTVYKTLFEEFFNTSDTQDIIDGTVAQMESFISVTGIDVEKIKEPLAALRTYMGENMKTLMLNSYIGQVTEDDLKALCELQRQPSAQAVTKAGQRMTARIIPIGTGLVSIFATWLDKKLQTITPL